MSVRIYRYVGPPSFREAAIRKSALGCAIEQPSDLQRWIERNWNDAEADNMLMATFTVSCMGKLYLAPRRSEHVACAGGQDVLSAGEIGFSKAAQAVYVSNQSTGYCPEPESWPAVAAALVAVPIACPQDFTLKVIFRSCPACQSRNIVKDNWFACALCNATLPRC